MEQLPKIVQQRLQATAKAGEHPDPDLLTAFAEKSLNERERAQVLQHLGQCTNCRNVVSLAMPEIVAPFTIPARSRWLTWPVLRWGAMAACVVVVGAAVTLHRERRQGVATFEAQKPASPSPSANLNIDSQDSNRPAQKLAEKIPPPSPFQSSDRAFDSIGRLAKQREDKGIGTATGAGVIGGLETGRLQSRPLENGVRQTPPGESTYLAENRHAKTDAFGSGDKPSAPLTGQVAPVPSAPTAAKSKLADTEEQAKERNENLDDAPRASSEMVTVEAEPVQIETAQATVSRAKDEADKKAKNSATAAQGGMPNSMRTAQRLSTMNKATLRWTLSPDGVPQRSFDSGKTWQAVPVAENLTFRALAANDSDIWVGGAAGALYHSADAGQHWRQVKPVAGGELLTSDIVGVEFSDYQNGKVITTDRQSWTTNDGGVTWHRF
jgi:hypothetical protein